MTLAHFFTWQNWTLLGLNIAAESAVLYLAFSRKLFRTLVMLLVFAAFSLLVDVGGCVLAFTVRVDAVSGHMWSSHVYWNFYWTAQILAGTVVLLLSLQILTVVLPPWKNLISLVFVLMLLALGVVLLKLLPLSGPSSALKVVSTTAAISVLSLPLISLVRPAQWPKGISLIVAGLVVSTVLQIGCAIGAAALHTLAGLFNMVFRWHLSPAWDYFWQPCIVELRSRRGTEALALADR